MIADTLIEVSDYSTMFKYDFRKDKEIEFVSDPSGADLYLNDEYVGKTPMKLTLKYASYRVEARLNADETDARDFTVNELVEDRIVLEPIEKKHLRFSQPIMAVRLMLICILMENWKDPGNHHIN